MELDELRNILGQVADNESTEGQDYSFIYRKGYDPFQQIKKRCGWIFIFFVLATVIFYPFLLEKKNPLALILYLILSIEPVISLIGYLQIKSFGRDSGNIKQNLIKRVRRLRSIFYSYIYLNLLCYLVLVCALEYMIRGHSLYNPVFEIINFPIRLIIYLLFICFQYWQKKRSYTKNYGGYLSSMIQLLNQTHE